ncbi:MAG TPA: alginate lyase family protein [Burkholderiales bacterium]|jgi:hypothetical protein
MPSHPESLEAGLKPAGAGTTLRWQLNRLRCMTPGEVGHRLMRRLADFWPHRETAPNADLEVVTGPWLPPAPAPVPAPYLEAAARLTAGRLQILSLTDCAYGMPPRWNRNPQSGHEWPLGHGTRLPFKDDQYGDIKYLWEPNRHLHLVTLAQAYRLSGDVSHAQALFRLLDSWFEQCPHPLGPNWASAMEAALRLINWSLCWQLLGGAASPLFADAAGAALRARWLESVYLHTGFVRQNLSLYSSANNHLIGELTGIFIASRTWPHWKEMRHWGAQARRRLEQECLAQNGADGVNLEQASSYHLFVFEYLLIAGLCARSGDDFSAAYWQRLEAMADYLCFLGSFGAELPSIGDCDDASVARLSPLDDFDMRRAMLGAAALAFGRADLARAAGALDEHAAWLVGADAGVRFEALLHAPADRPPREDFPDGGYYGLRGAQGRLRALFDIGPLGYTRIAAHGHADALAVLLWLDGRPLLIDAGTYCYNDRPQWRGYFRGTAAHNTVRVDGLDQSVSGGPFMWLDKAHAQRVSRSSSPQHEAIGGSHDGYRRLADPVTHAREVELHHTPEALVVTDTLRCRQPHLAEICWHFTPEAEVAAGGASLTVRAGAAVLRIDVTEGAGAWHLYRGQEDPPWGWHSPRFGVKTPATTAVWRAGIEADSRFKTSFTPLSIDAPG